MVKYPDATFEGYPVPTYVAKESVIAFRCREKYFDGQFYARCEGNNLWKRQGPECTCKLNQKSVSCFLKLFLIRLNANLKDSVEKRFT